MSLTYLHSIMLLRNGVHNGNSEGISTGIHKFSTLFYVRRHPQYQIIVAVNTYILGMMPDTVKGKLLNSFAQSRTNNVGHYQGGDAMLEEINTEDKSWKSTGIFHKHLIWFSNENRSKVVIYIMITT